MKGLALSFLSFLLLYSLANAKINIVGNIGLSTIDPSIHKVAEVSQLTHLNLNYLEVDSKYHLVQPFVQQKSLVENLNHIQHLQEKNHNIKVYLTVGSDISSFFPLLVDNPNHRVAFINSIKNILLLTKVNGININWQEIDNQKDRINAVLLLKELHDALEDLGEQQHKEYEISYSVNLDSIKKYPKDWSKILYYANYINLFITNNQFLHQNTIAVNSLLSLDSSTDNSMQQVFKLLQNNNIVNSKLVLFFKLEGIKYENVPNEILQFYSNPANILLPYDLAGYDVQRSLIPYTKIKDNYLYNDDYILLSNFNKVSLLESSTQHIIIAYLGERFLSHFVPILNDAGVYGIGINDLEATEEVHLITELSSLQEGLIGGSIAQEVQEKPAYESSLEKALHNFQNKNANSKVQ
ncbi:glycoside hydrolase family 18 [Candidatus Hepatincola sp. Av]